MSVYTPIANGEKPAHTAINQRMDELFNAIQSALAGLPIGSVLSSGVSALPAGWLDCDGSAVSRSVYSSLFLAIGTTYGSGDGLTTFNLPDLRGRSAIGQGTGPSLSARAIGVSLGEENHQLTIAEMASHTHTVLQSAPTNFGTGAGAGLINTINPTGSTGSDTPHNNMQPSLGLRSIIRGL